MNKAVKPVRRRRAEHPTADLVIERFQDHLRFTQARHWEGATPHDQFVALSLAVRDCLVDAMIATQRRFSERDVKRVYYLSLEYLLGQQLRNNLVALRLYDDCGRKLAELGADLEAICRLEPDAGLGNGGLGRLAACYLDSAATLHLPVYGYGIRYEYGIFEQDIFDGWQSERPDYWLRYGSPWEIVRPEYAAPVRLYGWVEEYTDERGRYCPTWRDTEVVMGVPYDIPMVAYGDQTVNLLRLWAARASESFNLEVFNRGGYIEAVRERVRSETISKVLYPSDAVDTGRELRLIQEYFFVACTLADVLRRYDREHETIDPLPDKIAVQLNDTHPALAIAELMRILVDERGLAWEQAWEMTRAVFSYTNHTLLPEALEIWPVPLVQRVLPRHLQIIYEINRRFLQQVDRRWPADPQRLRRLSLIDESGPRYVRMAHLAIVGSHAVNGVAQLHTRLLRERVFADFAALWPEQLVNVTNGVTPRRWLLSCNPGLAAAITRRIGAGWITDLEQLRKIEAFADDPEFQQEFRRVKHENKQRLAEHLRRTLGLGVSPDALFDVQVKRIHEYKRQLLNILQVIVRYQRLLDDPKAPLTPRVAIFGGKAAPAYWRAKLIIKLINDVARTVNRDGRIGDRLRVAFVPNYQVSLAELIIPAADLSEQISTAGMEASGTGNMKFALNGALTIGTLDGANIEIREAVGAENFFLFGLTADEVGGLRPRYAPWQIYWQNEEVRRALDAVARGEFNLREPGLFRPVFDWLTQEGDRFLLLADLDSYLQAQQRVDQHWRDPAAWTRSAILNVARIGRFSSDRSVRQYAEQIWGAAPCPPDRAAAGAGKPSARAVDG